jgi:hypothetical protein
MTPATQHAPGFDLAVQATFEDRWMADLMVDVPGSAGSER